jgi:ribonuclease D
MPVDHPNERSDDSRVVDAAGLRGLVGDLRRSGRFALDTEFVSEATFEPVLCLIQAASADRIAAIDALALDDLGPLWELVLDPSVEIVMHASGEDLRIIKILTGQTPMHVYDVQIAAGFAGHAYPLSLGNLVHQALGVSLPGGETRTDWRRRPLSSAQIRYALDDVRHLLEVHEVLAARLDSLGRSAWALEEMKLHSKEIDLRAEDSERWRRLPGLSSLSRRGLEAARRLYEWRAEESKAANRPVKQFLRDDLLVAIAKRQPGSRKDLEALRDFNRPHLLSKGVDVLRIIAEAKSVPDADLPSPNNRSDDRFGQSMLISLLSAALARTCIENELAPSLAGSAQDIRDLIRWKVEGSRADRKPDLLKGWRGEICGKTLLDVIEGKSILRVADLESEIPILVEPREPIRTMPKT